MPQYHSLYRIPAGRRNGEPHLQELLDYELNVSSSISSAIGDGCVLTPEAEEQINSIIESAKSKIIREFRNLYPIHKEMLGIVQDSNRYMINEYRKLYDIYPNETSNQNLSDVVKKLSKNIGDKEEMDKSKIRTEFNQRVMGCIYDQVPKRVAEVLSIADPKGRNKHLVEKERRIQDCMKDFDPH